MRNGYTWISMLNDPLSYEPAVSPVPVVVASSVRPEPQALSASAVTAVVAIAAAMRCEVLFTEGPLEMTQPYPGSGGRRRRRAGESDTVVLLTSHHPATSG